MQLTEALKKLYIETAGKLSGPERRRFMAQVVLSLGKGGQRRAEEELGWNRGTIRKGLNELFETKKARTDRRKTETRGRKSIDKRLPNLKNDMKRMMEMLNPQDPIYIATEYYTGVTVSTLRRCLVERCGYEERELPSNETLRKRLRKMGYHYGPS